MTPEGNIPINLKVSVYERLNLHKREGESFNSVIKRILDEWEKIGAT